MNCRKSCNNFPTCRFSEEGSRKDHCNFYIEIETPETTNPISSTEFAGYDGDIHKLTSMLIVGLNTDGARHKQYYLEEVLRELVPDEFKECKAAWQWEDGMPA